MVAVAQQRDWQKFEAMVLVLLRLAGYEVTAEQLVTYKKADLVFEETHLGSRRRVVVECKAYEKPLSQDDVSQILANYQPLYERGVIDQLLLVTARGLSPTAVTMVNASRLCSHMTLLELETSIMDFSPYVMGLTDQYKEDALDRYYIPPRYADGDLETYVRHWLEQATGPLALLGSYGMGKTSFARHLAAALAKEHFDNRSKRIPILLRLGEISSEQSLEGLLGKAFTAISFVRNYNFNAFMALNNLGRFVIFLDGFDEMKHTLTWEQCRYNFRQLNRLVSPESRVVLLGRPTAFLSEDEQNQVLHGRARVGNSIIKEPDWPDYEELNLVPFTKEQVEAFLRKYFNFKLSSDLPPAVKLRVKKVLDSNKIEQVASKQLSDIARRPVQLKMIAEILPEWDQDPSTLTVTILYSYFIDLVLKRESEKLSRHRFSISERREFALYLALWLWTTKQGVSLTAEDIPEAFLERFSRPGEKLDAVRRDLVAACFLDKKQGGALYFPHRSFQEFLVAEAVCEGLSEEGSLEIRIVEDFLTDEIAAFISDMVSPKHLLSWETKLRAYRGLLSSRFIQMMISEPWHAKHIYERLKLVEEPWYLLACTLALKRNKLVLHTSDEFRALLAKGQSKKRHDDEDVLYAILCHLCIVLLTGISAEEVTASFLRLAEFGFPQGKNIVEWPIRLLLRRILVNKKRPRADIRGTYSVLCEYLSDYCLIQEWVVGSTIRADDFEPWMELPTDTEEFSRLNRVLEKL